MNKQELIERIEGLKNIFGNKCEYVKIDFVIELASELDEPEKVKVPQSVADWIEESKQYCETVVEFFGYRYPNIEMIKYFSDRRKIDLVARAWLDGYEVEKEKRYRVKFIQTGQHIAKNIYPSGEYFVIKTSAISSTDSFTRKELEEAGFGWVFDCEGIEIEEVE